MGVSNIPPTSVPDPVSQRRKQILYLIVGVIGLLGVIWAIVSMQDRGEVRKLSREEVKKEFEASGRRMTDQEVWVAKSEQELQKMREESDQLKREIENLRRQLDVQNGRQRAGDSGAVSPPPPPPPPLVNPVASRDSLLVPPGNLPNPAPGAGRRIKDEFDNVVTLDLSNRRDRRTQNVEQNPGMAEQGVTSSGALMPESEIFRIVINPPQEPSVPAQQDTKRKRSSEDREQPQSHETYLPAGSFVRGVLLAGVDAPASTQAQSNPHPVLIRVKDLATLPNRFRSDVRECFITGAAYGDISSERAYIRTETLSCVQKDGQVIEAKVNGYVTGEDGKTGMRGRLVTKQGQMLARALLAGALSGIGKGVAESYKTTSVSALGTTTTTDPDKVVESGVASGIGNALDRLSKYYIDMAEKTFPIIEIDANRVVEVVFTRGVTLEGTLKNARTRNRG